MSKKTLHTGIAVTVTLVVVGIFLILGTPFTTQSIAPEAGAAAAINAAPQQVVMQDVVAGSGPAAKPGDRLTVHYTGQLQSGSIFDTSAGGQPYTFVLGAGEVIPGWDQGLIGVQAGAKRLILVPPQFGYGSMDYGPIPANSTLLFEVDVVKVEPAAL